MSHLDHGLGSQPLFGSVPPRHHDLSNRRVSEVAAERWAVLEAVAQARRTRSSLRRRVGVLLSELAQRLLTEQALPPVPRSPARTIGS
jgi:hypothetical protein